MQRHHNEFQIFFHIGLGRAASTFLQNRIFPKLEGIRYIPRNRYRSFSKIIDRSHQTKYLVSREAALRLKGRIQEFSQYHRDGKVILVLRRHDQWLASHYRRYVKNGGSYAFKEFVDLDSNRPELWGKHNIEFMKMIRMIEDYFSSSPLVLFQEELSSNLESFVSRLTRFTETRCDLRNIKIHPVHSSYSTQRLKIVRRAGSFLFPPVPTFHPNPNLHRINRRLHLITCHLILLFSRLVPPSFIENDPLIPPKHLARIRDETADDWARCLDYAEQHNPLPNRPIIIS